MITKTDRDNIDLFVKTSLDMNPETDILTAIKEAGEFYGVPLSETEINAIAFQGFYL